LPAGLEEERALVGEATERGEFFRAGCFPLAGADLLAGLAEVLGAVFLVRVAIKYDRNQSMDPVCTRNAGTDRIVFGL
jgi:hypothetical protein